MLPTMSNHLCPPCLWLSLFVGCHFAACTATQPSSSRHAAGPELPVTRVILYQNGIGYFERRGEVNGQALSLQVRPEQINDMLKSLTVVGVAHRPTHRPNELSGGQRQRVAIARALVTAPAVILADEPTGNLDTKTSIEILGLFEELHKEGSTIVMVTHEPDVAEYTERIITVRDGVLGGDAPTGTRRRSSQAIPVPEGAGVPS